MAPGDARRNYGAIVDQAHSSQTGEAAHEMKAILGARAIEAGADDEVAEDWDRLVSCSGSASVRSEMATERIGLLPCR